MRANASICKPTNTSGIIAFAQGNLATLKLEGWTYAETTAFQAARNAFGHAEQFSMAIHPPAPPVAPAK